jgi:hypothetical protein
VGRIPLSDLRQTAYQENRTVELKFPFNCEGAFDSWLVKDSEVALRHVELDGGWRLVMVWLRWVEHLGLRVVCLHLLILPSIRLLGLVKFLLMWLVFGLLRVVLMRNGGVLGVIFRGLLGHLREPHLLLGSKELVGLHLNQI